MLFPEKTKSFFTLLAFFPSLSLAFFAVGIEQKFTAVFIPTHSYKMSVLQLTTSLTPPAPLSTPKHIQHMPISPERLPFPGSEEDPAYSDNLCLPPETITYKSPPFPLL